jgi:hypothetical protein
MPLFNGFATLKVEVFKVRTEAATYPIVEKKRCVEFQFAKWAITRTPISPCTDFGLK